MPPSPFSLLLRHSSSSSSSLQSLLLIKTSPLLIPHHLTRPRPRPISTTFPSPSSSALLDTAPPPPPIPSDPKSTLSARLSFVFDQLDAIDRDRSAKDDALQRIRAWRQSKHPPPDTQDASDKASNLETSVDGWKEGSVFKKEVELVHPWPEWIELMERLVQQNYFDHRRIDEDRIARNVPIDLSGIADEVGLDFTRDWTTVRTACLNFGRDRFDILRSLSRKDLQILVGHGCPSTDPKVVFSAKLLRKYVHLDEGDVCSSCSLRSSCSRGYILTLKEDEARTLDVIRVLLTFGFDPIKESVENKPLMKMKSVKTVVRKLLHEVVKLSAVPIDPNLPPPVIKKAPPKVKQPPPPPKKRVGRDDVEMKKGDWLCPKCDFMNFAKNIVCLQCDAKRPKRQLLPGEWECPECNFLNYRRNMACFHCEHKRPPDEFMDNQMQAMQSGSRRRLDKTARMPGVSNAWNFDFDDNESDGADVAAFEFADSPRMGKDSSLDDLPREGTARRFEDDSTKTSRMPRTYERDRYSSEADEKTPTSCSPRTGFDDFDEEDDVDNYELEMPTNNPTYEVPRKNFSELEKSSDSEDFDDFGRYSNSPQNSKASLSGSEDDRHYLDPENDIIDHPNRKSSQIADSKQKTRSRSGALPYKERSFCSDDNLELNSSSDDDVDQGFRSKQAKGRQHRLDRISNRQDRKSDSEDDLLLDSESDDDDIYSNRNKSRGQRGGPEHGKRSTFRNLDDDLYSNRNRLRGQKGGPEDGKRSTFRSRSESGSIRNREFGSDNRMSNRRNSFGNGNGDLSSKGSRRNDRGSRGDDYGDWRGNDRSRGFDRSGDGEESDYRQRGRTNQFNDRSRNSQRNGRGNGRGSHGAGYGGGRGNDRFQGFDRPKDRDGSDYRKRGRNNQFTDRASGFDDDRPRRCIIER